MHATSLLTTDVIGGDFVAMSRKDPNVAIEFKTAEVALNGHCANGSREAVDEQMNGNGTSNGTNGDSSHGLVVASKTEDASRLSAASTTSHDAPAAWKVIPRSLAESVARTKAEYRQVGTSGLRVSNPILGTLCIGDQNWMNWILPEEEAEQLLLAAYARGINTWDTANAYSNGMSEEVIGRTIQKYRIPRRKVILMSKVGRIVADPETRGDGELVAFCDDAASRSKDYANQFGLSRSAIFNAVEDSLERLRTTYIDVLHVHRFDASVPPEETMRALHDLVCSGKVRYLAASSMWAFELATLQSTAAQHGWTKFIAVQNHYSLLYREEEREMIKYCHRTGLGIMPWSPLAEGYLARPRHRVGASLRSVTWGNRYGFGDSLADQAIIDRVEEVAAREGRTMSQIALAWLNDKVTAPIVGMNSIKRLEEACLRGYKLSVETTGYLEAPYTPKPVLGHA